MITQDPHHTDAAGNHIYFNADAFAPGPLGGFGNANRQFFHGPGINNFDISLMKSTKITESKAFEIRAEFFNVFNVVNFGLPSNIVLGPGFGEISRTAGTSRQIQFSLKLIY